MNESLSRFVDSKQQCLEQLYTFQTVCIRSLRPSPQLPCDVVLPNKRRHFARAPSVLIQITKGFQHQDQNVWSILHLVVQKLGL